MYIAVYLYDSASYSGRPNFVSSSTIQSSFDVSKFYSGIHSTGQFVSQSFFYSLGNVFDFALFSLQFLWSLILYISDLFKTLALQISSSLTSSKETSIPTPSESLKAESEQSYTLSLNFISDACSFIVSGFQTVLHSLWDYFVSFLNYGLALLTSLLNVILLILNSFWLCFQALFSAIGSVLLYVIKGSVAFVSKIFEVSQNTLEVSHSHMQLYYYYSLIHMTNMNCFLMYPFLLSYICCV